MEEKMSRWGVGPVFATLSISYGVMTLVADSYFRSISRIRFLSDSTLAIFGLLLIVLGIPFFLVSAVTVMRAYNSDRLVTDGIFGCCRHPLYASWVVFIGRLYRQTAVSIRKSNLQNDFGIAEH